MLETLGIGVIIGILWGAFGYAVAKVKNDEPFSPRKFLKTLMLGAILTAAAKGLGIPVEQLEGMTVSGFLTIVVDKLFGLILK